VGRAKRPKARRKRGTAGRSQGGTERVQRNKTADLAGDENMDKENRGHPVAAQGSDTSVIRERIRNDGAQEEEI